MEHGLTAVAKAMAVEDGCGECTRIYALVFQVPQLKTNCVLYSLCIQCLKDNLKQKGC